MREKEVTLASSGMTRPRMRRELDLEPSLHTTTVSSYPGARARPLRSC